MAEMEMGETPESTTARSEDNPKVILEHILAEGFALEEYLQEMERTYVTTALEHCNGNLSKAATLLKMNRTTLYSRLEKLGLR